MRVNRVARRESKRQPRTGGGHNGGSEPNGGRGRSPTPARATRVTRTSRPRHRTTTDRQHCGRADREEPQRDSEEGVLPGEFIDRPAEAHGDPRSSSPGPEGARSLLAIGFPHRGVALRPLRTATHGKPKSTTVVATPTSTPAASARRRDVRGEFRQRRRRNADGGPDLLPHPQPPGDEQPQDDAGGWSPGGFGPVVEVEQAVDDDRARGTGRGNGMPVAVRHHRR